MRDRFEDREGIIVDNSTGLMWMQNPLEKTFTWKEACEIKHEFAGYNNWRLPTIEELLGIVDYTKSNPACNEEVFRFDKCSVFWSSSPYVGNSNFAWSVNFYNGNVNNNFWFNAFPVRLVRG